MYVAFSITTGLKAKSATSGSVRGRRARPNAGSMRQQGRNSSKLRKALAAWKSSKRSSVWARKKATSTFIMGGLEGSWAPPSSGVSAVKRCRKNRDR